MNFYFISYDKINHLELRKRIINEGNRDLEKKVIYFFSNPFIFVRDCYIDIYNEIREIIIANQHREKLQKCFLVYGNEGIGKTTLCCFLSFFFNYDIYFKDFDIII